MSELVVKDLSIKFGGVKALTNVNLNVKEKAFVGLMGPNGAGKTTLINCISRIYDPTEGSITFDGQDLLKMRGDQVLQMQIARTFQDLNFFNHISNMMVIDYLRVGQFNPNKNSIMSDWLQVKGSQEYERELKKNARKVLDFFHQAREFLEPPEKDRKYPFLYGREGFPDLIDVEYSPIGNLSFAWRRRLDLARALVSKPKLLLLDEPAQGLAPSEIENLGKILKLIQSEFGVGALIIEHNIDTLMAISDYVVTMNYGQVVAEGLPEEVRRNPEVIQLYIGGGSSAKAATTVEVVGEKAKAEQRKTDQPVLELKNIDLFYGFAQALFSVSLKVYPRQVVSVLGTNGSGKSTLLRAISGVEKPSFGEIYCNGEMVPLGWPEAAVARGIQYVPQGHVIFPELTVLENLKIGAYIPEKQGLKLKDGLERVFHYFPAMKEQLKLQAASLSGGQRQMLAIGQAILGKPTILLLDEPSLGLSPMLVDQLFTIIQRISREEQCTVMIVEQSVAKALEISDYLFMMGSGVLLAEGSSAQFRENDSPIKRYLGFH